jgi:hypothetical protein
MSDERPDIEALKRKAEDYDYIEPDEVLSLVKYAETLERANQTLDIVREALESLDETTRSTVHQRVGEIMIARGLVVMVDIADQRGTDG